MIPSGSRFWWRFAFSALLSSLIVTVIELGNDLSILIAYRTQPWGMGSPWSIPIRWLGFVVLILAIAWPLWKMRKVRLRHHLLAGLAVGSVPVFLALIEFADLLKYGPGKHETVVVPYPCAELVRHEMVDLPGGVVMMLTLSLVAVLFKWAAYGVTRESTSVAWKAAGGIYVVAWMLVLAEPFHVVNRLIPSWTQSLSSFCAQTFH